MSSEEIKNPNFFVLKAMLFPVLIVPVLVMSFLIIRGNKAEQLYYQAIDATNRGDFVLAGELFEKAGALGHAESLYNLGLLYQSGALESDDAVELMRISFQQASGNGSLAADYELGVLAENQPMPDYDTAALYYRRAALGGHINGLIAMGRLHELGLGVNLSPTLAKEFYEKASQTGSAQAHTALGILYLSGALGEENLPLAEKHLRYAADKLYPRSFTALGLFYEKQAGVMEDALQLAEDCYRRAAELNDPEGLVNYGDILLRSGKPDEAIANYMQAIESYDFAPALHRVGLYYYQAANTDYKQARKYFERAARKGIAASWVNLGIMAELGQGGKVDLEQARECYSMAEKLGHADAANRLQELAR